MVKTRTTCRICGCELYRVLDLGNFNIAGYEGKNPIKRKVPLRLMRCEPSKNENACGLVQMQHSVSHHLLYDGYFYRSGVNKSMTDHLHGLAQQATDMLKISQDDLVIDIGCNDGTYLEWYLSNGYTNILGFEPSNISEYAKRKHIPVVENYFHADFVPKGKQAKLISSIAMFYDLEYPHEFVRSIKNTLATSGVWVTEQSYLPSMLESNSFDTICHEHLEYYCLSSLEYLLGQHGLEIIDVFLNKANGGSFRVYISHAGSLVRDEAKLRIQGLRKREFDMEIDTDQPYVDFVRRIDNNCKELKSFIDHAVDTGQKIVAYGASTKGSVTLQYAGLDNSHIVACADRNSDKWGTAIMGTNIPIISEEEARQMNPDYFLILPWHFLDEFLEREKSFLQSGGHFIVPMPIFKIIGAGNG